MTPTITAGQAIITANGIAADMADPDARQVTFDVTGSASGLDSEVEDIATALGDAIGIEARGTWRSDGPVRVENARLQTGNTSLGFAGRVDVTGTEGTYLVQVPDLTVFSGLAGHELGGATDLSAEGSFAFSAESFSLAVDGTTRDLKLGSLPLDGLLQGTSTITGMVARSEADVRFDEFQLRNPRLSARTDGSLPGGAADFDVVVVIEDVAAMTGAASGRVTLQAEVTSTAETQQLTATVTGEDLMVMGRPFADARATCEGTVAGADVDGDLMLSGSLDGTPVRASAAIETSEEGRRVIRELAASLGETSLTGQLALLAGGLLSGHITLQSADLSAIAALFQTGISGALSAEIELAAEDARQSAHVQAEARDLAIAAFPVGVAVGSADIALSVDDPFGTPVLSGELSAMTVKVGGFALPSVQLQASPSDGTTGFELRTELAGGGLSASGSLARAEGALMVEFRSLQLSAAGVETNLVDPFEVAIRDGQVAATEGMLAAGGGRVAVSGGLDETLALSVRMDGMPLALVNAFQPDLEAAGTMSGTVEASGTLAAPAVSFDVEASGITVALLDLFGIDPIALEAAGRYADETLTLDAAAGFGDRTITVEGSIGEELDVSVGVAALPLELVNAIVPEFDIAGTLSGRLRATGSLADPQATFEVQGNGITTMQLREADLPGIDIVAAGRVEEGTAILTEAAVETDGGRLTVEGSIGQELDVMAHLTEFPLSVASAVQPGLGLGGTISGTVSATGALFDPQATFDVQGSGITAAPLREIGLSGLELAASGSYAEGTARMEAASIELAGGMIRLEGSVGEQLDLTASFDDFPASVANTVRPDLDLSGSLSGTVWATGSLANPQISFEIRGTGISAAPLRRPGLQPWRKRSGHPGQHRRTARTFGGVRKLRRTRSSTGAA